ncbi:NADH-quinone oxidoreductase subunit NuoE [Pararhizobium mangrovi]|uniref:NADH-quinone oxidoreductase subunit NuoE n=1 Tax=Pararhizobium mangrovi TaxID=2590452 RepID=A0A506UBD8_9HYPH|nr:NADH-quinone oxidoreductase subunit NuoE [Pararhizobium mangrovi]TPW30451.1 NADH-quinone oxidoreductase subunit NuoE [Pararhizobium mangrovi]
MSVRRLAEDHDQPERFAFSDENAKWADATIAKYPEGRQQSAVIPLLMRAQEQEGWVTQPAIESVADMLAMPYIRVLEVATFYTQFQLKPVGKKAHIQVCGTTPCMLRGSEGLIEVCRRRIHGEPFELSEEGALSWEEVECQGACVNAPMVMIAKDAYEDLTPERLEEIIDAFEAGRGGEVPVGPQVDRTSSAPLGGLTSLTSEAEAGRTDTKSEDGKTAEQSVPPSKAGRPSTSAPETDATVDSPSPTKSTPEDEEVNTDGRAAKEAEEAGREGDSSSGNAASSATSGSDVGRDRGKPIKSVSGTAKSNADGDRGKDADEKDGAKTVQSVDGGEQGSAKREDGEQPPMIDKPKQPDDLKKINGIGPRIEERLQEIGVWTIRQISNWSDAEVAWVDAKLSFRGRIEREEWVHQAKVLTNAGGAE